MRMSRVKIFPQPSIDICNHTTAMSVHVYIKVSMIAENGQQVLSHRSDVASSVSPPSKDAQKLAERGEKLYRECLDTIISKNVSPGGYPKALSAIKGLFSTFASQLSEAYSNNIFGAATGARGEDNILSMIDEDVKQRVRAFMEDVEQYNEKEGFVGRDGVLTSANRTESSNGKMLSSKEVLLFIHGYNTSPTSAVNRASDLAKNIKWTGDIVTLCWPSRAEEVIRISFP